MRIHLLRHGQSTWNAAGRWQGHGDPELTAFGREQALAAGARLACAGIQHIVTSDLVRARETAQIIAGALGLAPEIDERWREREIGCWTGLTSMEIEARWPAEYAAFRAHDDLTRPGGGESNAMLRARALAALAALRERHAGRSVLVVTHRGIARMLAPATPLENAESCVLSCARGVVENDAPPDGARG